MNAAARDIAQETTSLPAPGEAPSSAPPPCIEVRVTPRAGASVLSLQSDGTWHARLRSPPVDGKANAELIELVARHFGCRKSAVSISAGATGRRKRVRIAWA